MNKDIKRERDGATFDPERLAEFLYGGKEKLRRRRYLQNLVLHDKYLQSLPKTWNWGREMAYDIGVKKSIYLHRWLNELGILNEAERNTVRSAAAPMEANSLGLHESMFVPTIMKQGTKEQIQKYAEPGKRYEIIGTYAQTELGHGTFIRGLETTATYDPATEEFVIHSPTVSSMKYWPGGMAKTCNYVILVAKLYSRGECHGIHPFVVQLRSLEDHTPMPGVQVGDIGNKMGFDGMDNGYVMFDNYRVPRDAMLMRYARLDKDGTFVPAKNPKVTYGSMVFIRAAIVGMAARCLAEVCTIATRYSAVRRQTEIRPGGPEPQILDYQTQQEKLFPLLAASYALIFAGNVMFKTYERVAGNIDKGQLGEMQMLHALASGMKALSSYTASDGTDALRKACGGHGYSHASGIPRIFANITPACTYEGENTVLYIQCGRYLVKCFAQSQTGQSLPSFMSYLSQPPKASSSITKECSLPHLIEAFDHATARVIEVAAVKINALVRGGQPLEVARNNAGVHLVKAAMLHSKSYVVKVFAETVARSDLHPDVARVLDTLCHLYAVTGILDHMGDFMQDGFVSGEQAVMVTDRMLSLLEEVRPDAVALVDAFDYPDHMLQSCLGRYDGQVYEALYRYAQDSPLNKQEVDDSYYTTLRPMMKGELNPDGPASRL